jgi:hypothetical protein
MSAASRVHDIKWATISASCLFFVVCKFCCYQLLLAVCVCAPVQCVVATLQPIPQAGHDVFLRVVKKAFGARQAAPPEPRQQQQPRLPRISSTIPCCPSLCLIWNPRTRISCCHLLLPHLACLSVCLPCPSSSSCPAGSRFPSDIRLLQNEMWDEPLSFDFEGLMGEQQDKARGHLLYCICTELSCPGAAPAFHQCHEPPVACLACVPCLPVLCHGPCGCECRQMHENQLASSLLCSPPLQDAELEESGETPNCSTGGHAASGATMRMQRQSSSAATGGRSGAVGGVTRPSNLGRASSVQRDAFGRCVPAGWYPWSAGSMCTAKLGSSSFVKRHALLPVSRLPPKARAPAAAGRELAAGNPPLQRACPAAAC